jgi:hypothetical protein
MPGGKLNLLWGKYIDVPIICTWFYRSDVLLKLRAELRDGVGEDPWE